MQIPFGEWLPDQPEHLNPGANVATNVYYALNSYKRFPSLVNYSSNNISANSRGAGSFRDNAGNVYNFVATNTDLYQLDGGTFTSRKGSLTGTNTDFWTFTQFVVFQTLLFNHNYVVEVDTLQLRHVIEVARAAQAVQVSVDVDALDEVGEGGVGQLHGLALEAV